MSSGEKTRHVTARICVEGKTVLMRIIDQQGIGRGCGWALEDHNVARISFKSQSEAREHARKIFETVNALNGQPTIPNEGVPCRKCGRPPVLFEYSMRQARWAVRCRDVDCGNGVNAPIISEAWAIWAADNRVKLAVPAFEEGVWYTIGDE